MAADLEAPTSRAAAVVVSAITPGSVNRTSVNLTASYATTLALRYGSRAFSVDSTATITNTSGGPIDRIELNTIAARLGGAVALATKRSMTVASRKLLFIQQLST